MPDTNLTTALRHLAPDDTPDGELLTRYVQQHDETAFDHLVRRHGGMVRAVCRRVLRNESDADDAVQATFLVLVRKAAAVRDRNGVANWLFGVAHNVAVKARHLRARRRTKEAGVPPRSPEAVTSEFAELVHTELAKLTAAYRTAVVLCDLEGRTVAEAAKVLNCPPGTVASRLARGREKLAERLTRYGLSVSAGLLSTLVGETAKAAGKVFDPTRATPAAHTLANETIRAMFTTPKLTKLAAITLGVLMLGGGAVMLRGTAQEPALRVIRKNAPVPKEKQPTVGEVLAEALKAAEQVKERENRAVWFQFIAVEQGRSGDRDAARKTFQKAVETFRGSALKDAVSGIPGEMVKAGLPDDAYEFLTEYGKSKPNELDSPRAACGQYCRGTGYTKLLSKLAADTNGWERDRQLSYLVGELAAADKFQDAEKTLTEMTTDTWRVQAHSFLAVEYHRAKDPKAAQKHIRAATDLLDATVAADQKNPGKFNVPLIEMRTQLAPAVARTGDFKTAWAIVEPLRFDWYRSLTLLEIVDAALAADDMKASLQTAEMDSRAANQDRYLLRIVKHHSGRGEFEQAAKVIGQMKRDYWKALGQQYLAIAHAKAGKTADATKALDAAIALVGRNGEKVGQPYSKNFEDNFSAESPDTLRFGFAQARVAMGVMKSALDEAKQIEDPRERTRQLLFLARGFRKPLPDEER